MTNWILAYADRIRERANDHLTLGQTGTAVLKASDVLTLGKLHEAAIDLQRIVELELNDRSEREAEEESLAWAEAGEGPGPRCWL